MTSSTGIALKEARWTHVALPTGNLDRAIAFYTEFTPLVVVERFKDAAGESVWLSQCAAGGDAIRHGARVVRQGQGKRTRRDEAVRPHRHRGTTAIRCGRAGRESERNGCAALGAAVCLRNGGLRLRTARPGRQYHRDFPQPESVRDGPPTLGAMPLSQS